MMEMHHGTRLEGLFASAAIARPTIRRQVFHRSSWKRGVLPLHLPCSHCERRKCALFPDGGGRGGSWLQTVFAVPSGVLARNPGMGGNAEYGFTRASADQ